MRSKAPALFCALAMVTGALLGAGTGFSGRLATATTLSATRGLHGNAIAGAGKTLGKRLDETLLNRGSIGRMASTTAAKGSSAKEAPGTEARATFDTGEPSCGRIATCGSRRQTLPSTTMPDGITYVTLPDGVRIALRVVYPPGFANAKGRKWPALFNMDGYGGANDPNDDEFKYQSSADYVVVYASIRGTGCSGGHFKLFSWQSAIDGREIIDRWIARQSWSNGRVGIFGHSYSGITGLFVAETQPRHLVATAVSGLVGDLYRDLLYMGGVPNMGFPVLWAQLLRPEEEMSANGSYVAKDSICRADMAQHDGTDLVVPPKTLLNIYTNHEDIPTSWAARRSPIDRLGDINRPIWIGQQYEDEQTGPRAGVWIWQHLPTFVPARLVLTNGVHTTNHLLNGDRLAWLNCWVIQAGKGCRGHLAARRSVELAYEATGPDTPWQEDSLGPTLRTTDFPVPGTDWQRFYLLANHTLSSNPGSSSGKVTYLSTTAGRESTGDLALGNGALSGDSALSDALFTQGPDEARWTMAFSRKTVVAGPADLTLWATSTAANTDFFVSVMDEDLKTGQLTDIEQGLLRASFRAVSTTESERVQSGPFKGQIYWPYHPFVSPKPITPGRPFEAQVLIYPFAHVFYPGHALVLQVQAPPVSDPLSAWYLFGTDQPPALNSILDSPGHRSSVLLPILDPTPTTLARAPGCGDLVGEPCSTVSAGKDA